MSKFNLLLPYLSVAAFAIAFSDSATGAQAPVLITSAVNEGQLVSVARSTPPLARQEFDQGPAPSSLLLNRMLLVLKRSPEREAALETFLTQLQQPSSPNYHKWLAPDEFGRQFGASDADIQTITSWLQDHGFQVQPASHGRVVIEFSGTAGQVQQAFHTQIHKFLVNGVTHWANVSEQQIPAALAPAVAGVHTLHNFVSAPQVSVAPMKVPVNAASGSPNPQYTTSTASYLSPGDYAIIYNANPLYPAITGAGVTIAVVGRTNIILQDVVSFRSKMGLPVNPPNIVLNGPDPGDLGGGEEVEAVLDTSWAGAIATGATVDLVVSATTSASDGADLSEIYIVDNNLANVMTESFGACEASLSTAQQTTYQSLAQQAAAEGITYTVAGGDSGSAGCDDFNTETSASGPLSVNGLGSSPYDLSIGGTEFNENGNSSYWNLLNTIFYVSATSYIPEDVWNSNCTGAVCGTGSILAAGGGSSAFYAKPAWQAGVVGIPADGARDVPDVSLSAAGHDPYLLCLEGSCSSGFGFLYAVYGTSAATPSFASIVALINQKAGDRQGQIAPHLYQLAAAETLAECNASNPAQLPAATCIFNDVTVGTNAVPGEVNYNTGLETYPATVGYDLASGLGSVNIANLVNSWGGAVVIAPSASLAPAALTFASQTDGTTSPAQTLTLSNSGNAALNISDIALSGAAAADFAVSSNCTASVAAGGNCAISVTFTPRVAGTVSANLVVTDNSGNTAGSTQSVALSGTGAAPTSAVTAATFNGQDFTTQGTWTGHYGANGQVIPAALNNLPAYAALNITGASTYVWTASSSDPRALQKASGSRSRIASAYYSFGAFTLDLNLTDGNAHNISLYLCDWDNYGRTETITIIDAASKAVLSTQEFSSFTDGIYATWAIKGHVRIQVTNVNSINALVNGIFFDPPTTARVPTASVSYVLSDTTTQGTWTGKYGANGQLIANDLTNLPAFANLNFIGASTYTWTTNTTDPRALQQASGSASRIASAYYSYSPFAIDLNLTDGYSHKVSLYLCDWDDYGRAETISIVDAASQTVLNTQSFSNFSKGVWATWIISGHVQIKVTYTAGINGIVNAIFFGPAAVADYSGLQTTAQGTWTGNFGADGQVIANDISNVPAYADLDLIVDSTYTWTTSTSDPRALQIASGSSSRIASTFMAYNTFTIDLNLTDGNTHKISLYLCDWDHYGRAETITILDAATQTVINSQSFASFSGGIYAVWNIKGHVQIQVIRTAGNNAIVNALFFN